MTWYVTIISIAYSSAGPKRFDMPFDPNGKRMELDAGAEGTNRAVRLAFFAPDSGPERVFKSPAGYRLVYSPAREDRSPKAVLSDVRISFQKHGTGTQVTFQVMIEKSGAFQSTDNTKKSHGPGFVIFHPFQSNGTVIAGADATKRIIKYAKDPLNFTYQEGIDFGTDFSDQVGDVYVEFSVHMDVGF